jgi:hypothetical protein
MKNISLILLISISFISFANNNNTKISDKKVIIDKKNKTDDIIKKNDFSNKILSKNEMSKIEIYGKTCLNLLNIYEKVRGYNGNNKIKKSSEILELMNKYIYEEVCEKKTYKNRVLLSFERVDSKRLLYLYCNSFFKIKYNDIFENRTYSDNTIVEIKKMEFFNYKTLITKLNKYFNELKNNKNNYVIWVGRYKISGRPYYIYLDNYGNILRTYNNFGALANPVEGVHDGAVYHYYSELFR